MATGEVMEKARTMVALVTTLFVLSVKVRAPVAASVNVKVVVAGTVSTLYSVKVEGTLLAQVLAVAYVPKLVK